MKYTPEVHASAASIAVAKARCSPSGSQPSTMAASLGRSVRSSGSTSHRIGDQIRVVEHDIDSGRGMQGLHFAGAPFELDDRSLSKIDPPSSGGTRFHDPGINQPPARWIRAQLTAGTDPRCCCLVMPAARTASAL